MAFKKAALLRRSALPALPMRLLVHATSTPLVVHLVSLHTVLHDHSTLPTLAHSTRLFATLTATVQRLPPFCRRCRQRSRARQFATEHLPNQDHLRSDWTCQPPHPRSPGGASPGPDKLDALQMLLPSPLLCAGHKAFGVYVSPVSDTGMTTRTASHWQPPEGNVRCFGRYTL